MQPSATYMIPFFSCKYPYSPNSMPDFTEQSGGRDITICTEKSQSPVQGTLFPMHWEQCSQRLGTMFPTAGDRIPM